MPKFKVCDIINNAITSSYFYTVTRVDDLRGVYTLFFNITGTSFEDKIVNVDKTCVLVSPVTQSSPPPMLVTYPVHVALFKVGAEIVTKWNNELKITDTDDIAGMYYYRVIKSNNPMKVGTTDKETFQNAHDNWKLKIETPKAKMEKVCTCDSKTLFNRGCKCGSIESYKPKFIN